LKRKRRRNEGNEMKLAYENLEVWNISRILVKEVYLVIKKFPKNEEFALSSQLKRAAVSVNLNIAEGSIRGSKKEFQRFIRMALGSLVEVRSCLAIAIDLGFIKEPETKMISELIEKNYFKLIALLKSISKDDSNNSYISDISNGAKR